MAYSNFTFDDLSTRLGVSITQAPLFHGVEPKEPGTWLTESLERGGTIARFNEKSRSEYLVAPILARLRDFLGEKYSHYSGAELYVDPDRGLTGECDFLLSRSIPFPYLQAPLMVVVEAKKGDIEASYPQCIAQMVGMRIFNERSGQPTPKIHGCVTTGDLWRFFRLEENSLTTDSDLYYLTNLDKILGILVECVRANDAPTKEPTP